MKLWNHLRNWVWNAIGNRGVIEIFQIPFALWPGRTLIRIQLPNETKQSKRSTVYLPKQITLGYDFQKQSCQANLDPLPSAQLPSCKTNNMSILCSGRKAERAGKPRNNQKQTSSTQCAKTRYTRDGYCLSPTTTKALALPLTNTNKPRWMALAPPHWHTHTSTHPCPPWEASFCFLLFWIWCCLVRVRTQPIVVVDFVLL